jgi:mannose-1-phosphate guanylyltransferase
LVQEAYERLARVVPEKDIYISTVPKFIDELKKQLPKVSEERFIVEPAAKNTAGAFAYIAAKFAQIDPNATIATIASDHLVRNVDIFVDSFKTAAKVIEKHPAYLVAIGISPDFPSTELGYMRLGQVKTKIDGQQVFWVSGFVEKPDKKTAQNYLQSWEYLWNGCYYFFKAKEMLKWTKEFRPKIHQTIQKIQKLLEKEQDRIIEAKIKALYEQLPREQFEYAVVEDPGFKRMLALPADLGWSDIGTWGTLCDVLLESFDSHIISRGNHVDLDSQSSLVYADHKMIATIGVKDLIVVDTEDVILIADKTKSFEMKKFLDKLKAEGKHPYL